MLEKTSQQELQRTEAHQDKGLRRIIRTFNPEVPGYVFWPVIFGMAAMLQQMVLAIN